MNTDAFVRNLTEWQNRVAITQDAQTVRAAALDKKHYSIGLPATILAAIAATTTFVQLGKNPDIRIQIMLGTISLVAAILSAVMTFFSHAKRSELSRSIAAQLGNIRREIDIAKAFPPKTDDEMVQLLRQINDAIAKVSAEAPTIVIPLPPQPPSFPNPGPSRPSRPSGPGTIVTLDADF